MTHISEVDENGRVRLKAGSEQESTNLARKMMEDFLGRDLPETQVVHHKNGDPADDRLSNLAIMTQSEHNQLHQSQKSDIPPFKAQRLIKMAQQMDDLDIEFLSEFSGESVEEVKTLFSHKL